MTSYSTLNASYTLLQADYSQLTNSYDDLNSKYSALQTDYFELTSSYSMLNISYSTLQNQYSSLQTQIDDLNSQVEIQYDSGYNAGYAQGITDAVETGYLLFDPTYSEALDFVADNQVDKKAYVYGSYTCVNFASDFKNDAFEAGYRCGLVYIEFPDSAHDIICFETTDMGMIYIEPQTDEIVNVVIGQPYWDRTKYYPPSFDDTIMCFEIAW
jgi:hypothetical protein